MPYRGISLGESSLPARIAATIAVLLALTTLCGWAFNIRTLTSLIPGAAAMKVNSATCVLLCGIALLILSDRASTRFEAAARAAAILASLVGLATLAEYLFEWRLGIDELLIKDLDGKYNVFRGRMSPFTASALIVLGLATAGVRLKRTDRMARIAGGIGLSIGLLSLIGYLWNASDIVTDRLLPPVALNTALCLVSIGMGVLLTRKKRARGAAGVELAQVEIKILVGFIAAVCLLISGGSFTYRNSVEFSDSVQWIAHTQEVRTTLADLYGSLAGAEVASRDYFLTKERAPWDEANRLMSRTQDNLQNLQRLIADNPQQLAHLSTLRGLVTHRLQTLRSTQTAFQDYGIAAVRAIFALSRRAGTVEDVRARVERMDALEKQLLDGRQAASARVRSVTLISLLITLTVAVSLFVALFRTIHREMLARRNAERALRDSDHYNRSILDSSPDCLWVLTRQGQVTQMNPLAMALRGPQDLAAIAAQDWCALWNEPAQQAARAALAQAGQGHAARFEGATAQASGRWWDVIVMPIRNLGAEPDHLLAVARDMTEVKGAEAELVEANRFLDSMIESLPVMVVVKDVKELRFIRHNRMFEQMLGMTREQIAGKTAYQILQPDEADLTVSTDRQALACGKLVDISERSIFTPSGLKIFNTKKVPIFGTDGRAQFLLAISSDITEVKLSEQAIRELNAELQLKAVQLEATNRELESFSYSVSHDLRAPLRAIDGFAQIIEEDYKHKLDEEFKRYLSVIRQNSKRMGELIDDLLAFSRLGRQPVARGEVNIDSLVREVIKEIELGSAAVPRDDAKAALIDVGQLPPALGDRTLLRQVWTNLILNAIKYSSKCAEPRIEIRGAEANEENQYSVRDNGVGFNMAYVAKLFGVFQRLHRADEFAGTGVGLAIVHRIVSRHGGKVWAEGKINEGAVFSFTLPRGPSSG